MVSSISWQNELLPLAQRFAARTAVVDRDGRVTYGELFARAAGIACAVQAAGASVCEPVGLLLPNGRDAVAASYGITLAGAAEARLNTALSPDELAHCLETAGIRVVVTDAANAARVSKLGAAPVLVETTAPADLARCDFPAVPAEGWGRIGFTSGTTGKPKGIVHSHLGRWTANVLLRASLPLAPGDGDNVLLVTPFSHGAALLTYAFLDGGAAITLLPDLDTGRALEMIEGREVNQVFAPPTVLAKLLSAVGERQYPGLEAIYTGTSPLTAELYRRAKRAFGPIVRVTYGKSEIWNPITVLTPQEADAWYGDEGEPTRPASAGRRAGSRWPSEKPGMSKVETTERTGGSASFCCAPGICRLGRSPRAASPRTHRRRSTIPATSGSSMARAGCTCAGAWPT